jgi:hypothetical protein
MCQMGGSEHRSSVKEETDESRQSAANSHVKEETDESRQSAADRKKVQSVVNYELVTAEVYIRSFHFKRLLKRDRKFTRQNSKLEETFQKGKIVRVKNMFATVLECS